VAGSDTVATKDTRLPGSQADPREPDPNNNTTAETEVDEIKFAPLRQAKEFEQLAMNKEKADPEDETMKSKWGFLYALLDQNYTFDAIISVLSPSNSISKTPVSAMKLNTSVRGIMDTGSEAFVIHNSIVQRAGLSDRVEPVKGTVKLRGLNEVVHRFDRCVKVTWHAPNHMNSREDIFYVVDEGPFDILIPNVIQIHKRHVEEDEHVPVDFEQSSNGRKHSHRKHLLIIFSPSKRKSKDFKLRALQASADQSRA